MRVLMLLWVSEAYSATALCNDRGVHFWQNVSSSDMVYLVSTSVACLVTINQNGTIQLSLAMLGLKW